MYRCWKNKGRKHEATSFSPAVGGAPANVCGVFIGSFLYQLAADDVTVDSIDDLPGDKSEAYLEMINI